MIYLERTVKLKQLTGGFSDGQEVEGVLSAEEFGSRITFRLSTFHLAPLNEGKYLCIVTNGKEIIELPLDRETTIRTELSLSEPFGVLLLFLHTLVTPVAYGSYQSFSVDLDDILSKYMPKESYDDTLLSEENYFAEESVDDSYYQSVKEEVEESFLTLPPCLDFQDSLPSAVLVRTGEALLGKVYQGNSVKYLLFGAKKRETLPKEHREKAKFIPTDFFRPTEGYFFLFQSGKDGKIV